LLTSPSLLSSYSYPAPCAICTLSLHDALPILGGERHRGHLEQAHLGDGAQVGRLGRRLAVGSGDLDVDLGPLVAHDVEPEAHAGDRKSTRLNSSHVKISYAVFCLKKKI